MHCTVNKEKTTLHAMPITKNKLHLQIHYLCIYKMRILMMGNSPFRHNFITVWHYTQLHRQHILVCFRPSSGLTTRKEKKRLNIYIHSVWRWRSQSFTINCNITIVYNILHMLILPSNAQDWHLHLHIRAYLNKPLGLQATSGSWKENKPTFWKRSLFSSVPWLRYQMWFSKQWFSHQIQMIAHVGFIAFSHHESFRLPHTHNTHICLHVYYKLFTWFIPLY